MIFSKRTFYWRLGSMCMMGECHWSTWLVRLVKVLIVGHLKKYLRSWEISSLYSTGAMKRQLKKSKMPNKKFSH